LLAVLGVVIVLRLQQGFLTADSALAAGRFLLRFAVLPIVLFVWLQRLVRRGGGEESRSKEGGGPESCIRNCLK
jgi:hypothetical protein